MIKPKIVLIAGPTGVGKTEASVLLAKKMNTEIISCDSMQIYRGMDIGTAKVTNAEMQGVVHHMIDIREPWESFSVYDYVSLATPIAMRINDEGKIPLLVGGTGLYADSLIKGIDFKKDAGSDEKYRKELEELSKTMGNEYVHDMLKAKDPESAQAIHPNNVKRVIRALEYHHSTGNKISDYNESTKAFESPYDSVRIYFWRDRDSLYDRIDKRVDKMLEMGLLGEVKELMSRGLTEGSTAIQALGYKETLSFLRGEVTIEEASERIKTDTRHYAKRQLTWFRRDREGIWLNLDEFSSPEETALRCLEIIEREVP